MAKTKAVGPSVLDAMNDPAIFGHLFKAPSWKPWKAVLKGAFGLRRTPNESKLFEELTARKSPPENLRELWIAAGRRSGKSSIAALIAVYLAFFRDWSASLKPGETGHVLLIAADRSQSAQLLSYIHGLIEACPMLEKQVSNRTAEAISLSNGITIRVATCSYRSVRGFTCVSVICDELAFWRSEESRNPDREVLRALRPSFATVQGSLLVCISSPYSKSGELWRHREKYYGEDHPNVLFVQAPSRTLNPSLPETVVTQALEEDPASARSEFLAQFRDDISGFVEPEIVESAVVPNRRQLPAVAANGRLEFRYHAFCDPSGGAQDSMTLAVAHRQRDRLILDCLIERIPPFSPESVVQEFAQVLREYGISAVAGDRYGGEWPRDAFRRFGIDYRISDHTAAQVYLNFLPLLRSGRVELLDNSRLVSQLCSLERRTAPGGGDRISHPRGLHDDLAVAACGALLQVANQQKRRLTWGRSRADELPEVRVYNKDGSLKESTYPKRRSRLSLTWGRR